jgi:lysophospholipase L1-like esterase
MKNLYIITLITLITFILYITHNTKEYFTLNKKTIILLGDSVFNNNTFVEKGKAVNELLQKNADENTTIICLARNDSTINNVYQQLENVNIDLNNKLITVFLSVGGNDIMNLQEENLDTTFEKYKTLIGAITTKLPNVKLVLLNIYYPANTSKYDSLIDKWNTNIHLEYETNNKNIYTLDLASLLKDPSDFVFNIEPSITGGEKIAHKILTT